MTRIKSILFASVVTLVACSSASAGDLFTRSGDLFTRSGDLFTLVSSILGIVV